MNTEKNCRYAYLDYLKLISIYFVIVIHNIGHHVVDYKLNLNWIIADIYSASARFAVPVFVMCSGVVFLRKKMDTMADALNFYKKYIPHFLCYIVVVLVIGKLFTIFYIHKSTSLFNGLFYNFYDGFGTASWYFFMLLGLLVVTPVLRQIVINPMGTKLFLALWLFYSILDPFLSVRLGLYKNYIDNVMFPNFFVGYYVLGYYLANNDHFVPNKILSRIILGSFVSIVIATFIACYGGNKYDEFYYYGGNPLVLAYSVSIFLLFKNIFQGESPAFIRTAALTTAYIYIVHNFLLMIIKSAFAAKNIQFEMFIMNPLVMIVSLAISLGYLKCKNLFFNKRTCKKQALQSPSPSTI